MIIFFLVLGLLLNLLLLWEFVRTYVYKKGAAYVGSVYINDDEMAKQELIDELDRAQRTVRMVGGEGQFSVYNDESVKEAFRRFHEKPDSKTMAIFWNQLSRDGEGRNGLEDLAREKVLELFEIDKRPAVHFRVVDGNTANPCVYIEEDHEIGQQHRRVQVVRGATLAGQGLEEAFDKLKEKAALFQT